MFCSTLNVLKKMSGPGGHEREREMREMDIYGRLCCPFAALLIPSLPSIAFYLIHMRTILWCGVMIMECLDLTIYDLIVWPVPSQIPCSMAAL